MNELNHLEYTQRDQHLAINAANVAGQTAISSIILASGGAVVALLALLGTLLAKDPGKDAGLQQHITMLIHLVGSALVPFMVSMFLGILTAGLTYFAQFLYASMWVSDDQGKALRRYKWGTRLNYAAMVAGVAALLVFGCGAIVGLSVLHAV